MTMNAVRPILEVEDLTVTLPAGGARAQALTRVSFAVRRGEAFAIVGESGCGKSLTANAVVRLLPQDAEVPEGRIRFEGTDLLSLEERGMRAVRGARIAMVFQEPATALNPVMTVGDQIAEMIRAHAPVGRSEARRRAVQWLERVRLPDPPGMARRFPHELSGGQKQRVMIAIALCAGPDLVIADEPTTALDVTLQAEILELLKTLQREEGLTLMLITHDLAVVSAFADRLALMYAGEVVECADVRTFFASPQHPYAEALLRALPDADRSRSLDAIPGMVPPLGRMPEGCRFAPRCAHARQVCRETPPPARPAASGSSVVRCWRGLTAGNASDACDDPEARARRGEPQPAVPRADVRPAGEPLLSVRGLSVVFRGRGFFAPDPAPSVSGASFDVFPGETVALVGESGSGKTTTGLALLGLLDARARVSGDVMLEGRPILPLAREARRHLRRTVQMIFQDPNASLDPRMTIRETLLEGMASLRPEWPKAERERRVVRLLDAVGLPSSAAQRYPHAFSGGQRQRVAVARALSVEPKLIVCDEPTSALDVSVQAQILNLLQALQRDLGLSFLFITHNFGVVEYLADRVLVMKAGSVVEAGPASSVLGHPAHPYTQSLLAAVPRLAPR